VIVLKYGIQRGWWCLEEAQSTYGMSFWRYIRKNWGAFSNFVSYKVGDGLRIRFWHDIWCSDSALKCYFPEFFSLARNKEALVLDYMDRSSTPHPLESYFIRDVHDWEIEYLDSFLTLLYSVNPFPGVMDSMVWTPSRHHGFAVKSYYTMLHSGEHSSFPWKSIWKVKSPPRIAFLLWATSLGRILTVDNLKRREFQLINWCCLCEKDEETINHFLHHCEYTVDIWNLVLTTLGSPWA
jgi:hypothetical protein